MSAAFTKELFFLKGAVGNLFCCYLKPNHNFESKSAVLLLPPFAEEMNKSRRMMSTQAAQLAERGHEVLIFDYYGTGDSEGDFSDATWDIWVSDVISLVTWLASKANERVSLLAIRMGALLVRSVLDATSTMLDKLVLWQPVINGDVMLNQFYRLKMAADLSSTGNERLTPKEIKSMLSNGDSVEIAGYLLNPDLVNPMSMQRLEQLNTISCPPVYWLELTSSSDGSLSIASQNVINVFRDNNREIHTVCIEGAKFWTTVEITDVPALHVASNRIF